MRTTRSREDIEAAFVASCRAELEAMKPGNVHKFAPGHGMDIHFVGRAPEEMNVHAVARGKLMHVAGLHRLKLSATRRDERRFDILTRAGGPHGLTRARCSRTVFKKSSAMACAM